MCKPKWLSNWENMGEQKKWDAIKKFQVLKGHKNSLKSYPAFEKILAKLFESRKIWTISALSVQKNNYNWFVNTFYGGESLDRQDVGSGLAVN